MSGRRVLPRSLVRPAAVNLSALSWIQGVVAILLLLSAPVQAQPYTGPLPVHQQNLTTVNQEGKVFAYPNDRPDRQQYDDPSQWPIDSFQGHWGADGVNTMFQPRGIFGVADMPCHGHIEPHFPRYAEWSAEKTLAIPYTFVLFHCDGRITLPFFRFLRDDGYAPQVVWQDTGTDTPPDMIGDPMGIKKWNVTVTFTPDVAGALVKHGWYKAHAEFTIRFNNNGAFSDSLVVNADEPFYALFNPEAPEVTEGPDIRVEVDPATFLDPTKAPGRFAGQFILLDRFMPTTVPLTFPWQFDLGTQGYGAQLPTPDEALLILDPDIHNGIEGIREVDVVKSNIPDTNNIVPNVFLDPRLMCANPAPASFPTGKHKYATVRFQPDDVFETAALIVFTLSADCAHLVSAPPPPPPQIVCVPPLTLQGNQCVPPTVTPPPPPPPPPPVVVTKTGPLFWKQDFINGVPQPILMCVDPDLGPCKPLF